MSTCKGLPSDSLVLRCLMSVWNWPWWLKIAQWLCRKRQRTLNERNEHGSCWERKWAEVTRSDYGQRKLQKGCRIVFVSYFGSGFGFFVGFFSWYHLPCICNSLELETRICHFAWYLLHFGMVTLHFAWYLLHLAMSAFHFAWYLQRFGTSTSHLHGTC